MADDSMRAWGRPDLTDDGLLIVDEKKLVSSEEYNRVVEYGERSGLCRHCSHQVPLENGCSTQASAGEFEDLCHAVRGRRMAGAA